MWKERINKFVNVLIIITLIYYVVFLFWSFNPTVRILSYPYDVLILFYGQIIVNVSGFLLTIVTRYGERKWLHARD